MFEPSSRYANVAVTTYSAADGTTIRYVCRRFVPPPGSLNLARVTVTAGDRLDLIAARTLGDPEQYWKIVDGTDTLDPPDCTAEPGRVLVVPSPIGGG